MSDRRNVIPVRNPRTGEADYYITPASPEEVAAECRRLRAAQPAWASIPVANRADVLRYWADAIVAARDRIGAAEAVDTGRIRVAHEVPMMVAAGLRGWADRAEEIINSARLSGGSTSMPGVTFSTQLVPYQLVGAITPWNHPFLLATLDAIPALLAGCAVLIKPSEIAPRFVEPVLETLRAVPELAAVLSFVVGDGKTGQALIANVDAQCFTGSIATGRKVAEACARRFIPAFLELGGKDAAIVTASADLDRAATAVIRGAVHNTGQICFATERVYVQDAVHDRFVDRLVRECESLELTWPDPKSGHIGPFILERQAEIVDAQLNDAVAQGAVIRTGGRSERLGGGLYMRATVITGVNHSMALMREETFGPVIPVMRYGSDDEAIELANDSEFGLSGAVIAGSADEAARLGQRMDAGAISLQDAALTIAIMRDAEKTSFRFSGLGGSRMGPASLLRFFRRKALILHNGPTVPMASLGERA